MPRPRPDGDRDRYGDRQMQSDVSLNDTQLERLPPQSVEAEQAVLGSILVNPESITRIVDVLDPEQFYRKSHQIIMQQLLTCLRRVSL